MGKKSKALFYKSFILSLGAVLCLGLVFLFGGEKKEIVGTSSLTQSNRVYTPRADDRFTVFVTFSSEPIKSPYAYFLLHFSAPSGEIQIIPLPKNLRMSQEGETRKILCEQFENSGVVAVKKALSGYFDADISAAIVFDNYALRSFLNVFDPVKIDIPQNLSQIDRERDIYIKFEKGVNLLSPIGVSDYLCCTAFDGGEIQALYEGARLICEFLIQNGGQFFKNGGESHILNSCDTDISVTQIEHRREALEFLFLNAKISAAKISGESKNMGTEFVLNEHCRSEISGILKR